MTDAEQMLRLAAEMLRELDLQVGGEFRARVYSALVEVAARRLDGVRSASVTTWDGRRFATVAATDDAARRSDLLRHEGGAEGSGEDGTSEEPAAPGFGWVLALPLAPAQTGESTGAETTEPGNTTPRTSTPRTATPGNTATLNLYSDGPDALDGETVQLATLLAIHAWTALAAADGEARAQHLERSRETTQRIGAAVGVLMVRNGVGHDEAMDLLRTTSQRSNTRVSDLADTVVDTGELPPTTNRGPTRRPRPRPNTWSRLHPGAEKKDQPKRPEM